MKLTLKLALTIAVTLSFSGLHTSSFAQDDLSANAKNQSLSSLFNCLELVSNSERLACQDTEIKKLKNAMEAKTLLVIDENSVKDIKKKSFGFSLPKLGLQAFDNTSEKTDAITLPVKSVDKSRRKLTVVMENGQIWQSVNNETIHIPKKGELQARIKSASLGSYLMRITSGKRRSKTIRVKRIE